MKNASMNENCFYRTRRIDFKASELTSNVDPSEVWNICKKHAFRIGKYGIAEYSVSLMQNQGGWQKIDQSYWKNEWLNELQEFESVNHMVLTNPRNKPGEYFTLAAGDFFAITAGLCIGRSIVTMAREIEKN